MVHHLLGTAHAIELLSRQSALALDVDVHAAVHHLRAERVHVRLLGVPQAGRHRDSATRGPDCHVRLVHEGSGPRDALSRVLGGTAHHRLDHLAQPLLRRGVLQVPGPLQALRRAPGRLVEEERVVRAGSASVSSAIMVVPRPLRRHGSIPRVRARTRLRPSLGRRLLRLLDPLVG